MGDNGDNTEANIKVGDSDKSCGVRVGGRNVRVSDCAVKDGDCVVRVRDRERVGLPLPEPHLPLTPLSVLGAILATQT